MAVILRDFLYLDGKVVRSYLSSLEGKVFEEETVTERRGTEAGGGVSAGIPILTLGGKGSRTTGTEITRHSGMSDDSLFQRLVSSLREADALVSADDQEAIDWVSLGRGVAVEVAATASFSKISQIVEAIESLLPLAEVVEVATGKSPIDSDAAEKIKGIRLLEKIQSDKGIACLFSAVTAPEQRFVAFLNPQYLRAAVTDFLGEMTLFCKVQRKVKRGETLELFNPLEVLQRIPLNREQRRKADISATMPDELLDTIDGPAFVVTPVAVYR